MEGKDEVGEGGIWRWLRGNEVGYVKKCAFVVGPQLFAPLGFQTAAVHCNHTHIHTLTLFSFQYLDTAFHP